METNLSQTARAFICAGLILFCSLDTQASHAAYDQISNDSCVVAQPGVEKGMDAILHGLSSQVSTNYGDNGQFSANAWTFSGVPGVVRSIVSFDLTIVPPNAVITSADLSLFAWNSSTGFGSHSSLSGANDAYLRRVIEPWEENAVNWNTSPMVTTQNQVYVPATNNPAEDYVLDVTPLVEDMILEPDESFGFQLSLITEDHYRMLNFCSSDYTDPARRPTLEVCYTLPTALVENEFEDLSFSLYPNPANDNVTISFSTDEVVQLNLIDFNGRTVKNVDAFRSGTQLSLAELPQGTYIVQISSETRVGQQILIHQ